MTEASFDVRLWQIEERPRARGRYRVRWKVAGRLYRRSFTTKTLAGAYGARRPATGGIWRRKVAKRPHRHSQHCRY